MTTPPRFRASVGVMTHPGRVRRKSRSRVPGRTRAKPRTPPPLYNLTSPNEDVVAVDTWISTQHMYVPVSGSYTLERPLLLLVADGVGGRPAGAIASAMAAGHLVREAYRLSEPESVRNVILEAHRAILTAAEEHPERAGMATTIAGLVLTPDKLIRFNVGDSRVYRYRDGFLQQVSTDDITAGERRRAAEEGRPANLVAAVLGGAESVLDPHVSAQALPRTSRWLLCTDGISDYVDATTLEACMRPAPLDTVLALYDVTMRAGAPDNLSAIVVDIAMDDEVG